MSAPPESAGQAVASTPSAAATAEAPAPATKRGHAAIRPPHRPPYPTYEIEALPEPASDRPPPKG
jgi:hypothetical protein